MLKVLFFVLNVQNLFMLLIGNFPLFVFLELIIPSLTALIIISKMIIVLNVYPIFSWKQMVLNVFLIQQEFKIVEYFSIKMNV